MSIQRERLARIRELEEAKRSIQLRDRLASTKFLPSQKKLLDAYNSGQYRIIIFCGPNQVGKSHVWVCCAAATCLGYEPWSNRPRLVSKPARVAVLLTDFDNHSKKVYEQNVLNLFSKEDIRVDKTSTGGIRTITFKQTGGQISIFTADQDASRLEGGTWDELYVDEPCPRSHYIALARGLQKTGGKTVFTMTPISEPWIADEVYNRAENVGGDDPKIYAITAFPEENMKSQGGFLEDEGVKEFWSRLSPEELEARKHGRFMHLIGRVYKSFDPSVHVVPGLPENLDPSTCPHGVSIDPHDRKPYAMGFYLVAPGGDIYWYDEWPNEPYERLKYWDNLVENYVAILQQKRYRASYLEMDPNYGNRRSSMTGMTIAETFAMYGYGFNIDIIDDLAAGHAKVNEYLRHDRTRPIQVGNQPKMFFLENCRNLIKGFQNYIWDDYRGRTADLKGVKEKPRDVYKDFPDVVRYAAMDDPGYFNPQTREHLISPAQRRPTVREWEGTQGGISERLKRMGYIGG